MSLTGGAAILARLRQQREAGKSQKKEQEMVVVIAYASQTGTSQDIALSINAECNERGIKSKVLSLNELQLEGVRSSKTPLLIAVVSSTGDGDPPDNSQTFFKDMKRAKQQSTEDKCFKGVKYTCLGLGDSNYTNFMAVPLRFKKGFDELGAERFYECRDVDEVDGLEELVEEWIDGLWDVLKTTISEIQGDAQKEASKQPVAERTLSSSQSLKSSLDLEKMSDSLMEFKLPPDVEVQGVPAMPVSTIRVVLSDDDSSTDAVEELSKEASQLVLDRFRAPLVSAEKMTAEGSDREVYLLTLDLKGSDMKHDPGDSLAIMPENDPLLVEQLLTRLKLEGSKRLKIITLEGTEKSLPHIDRSHSLRDVFLKCVDVCSVLKKTILRFLAQHCTDPDEMRRLKYLVSKSGREAYQKFIVSAKASLIDILTCFPSCQPPLAGLIEFLPPLMPRQYSIACYKPVMHDHVRVAFSVAKYSTPYGERTGVATGWMKRLIDSKQGDAIKTECMDVSVRSGGSFRPPWDWEKPMVLIGPGTGVAPFIGFLQERNFMLGNAYDYEGFWGRVWLFFGCRKEDEDFLFKSELQSFCCNGTVTDFHVAFSRQTSEKIYVQHLMLDNSEALFNDLFCKNGFVFVCGDGAAMAHDVHNCLAQILMRHGGVSETEAQERLSDMLKHHRYVKDIWS